MNIRKANIKDLETIVDYNYNLAYETENIQLDKNTLTSGVKNIILDNTKGIYHVCEIDGKVVGQIMYTYEWSDWRNGIFIWVQSVYVNKDYRGQGIFKALYTKVKEICESSNEYVGIRLYVEKKNYTAQKTYKNIGMHECNYYMYEYEK